MADAPKLEHKPPTELPLQAQTQKNIGRPKRTPDEQAEYFYDRRRMHILFFASSFLLLFSLVLMFVDDFKGVLPSNNRDWKTYQAVHYDLELGRLQDEILKIEESLKKTEGEVAKLDVQIGRAEEHLKKDPEVEVTVKVMDPASQVKKDFTQKVRQSDLEQKRDALQGPHKLKMDAMNFAKSDYVVVRWQFEEAEHHYHGAVQTQDARVGQFEKHYRHWKEEWEKIQERTRKAKEDFDAVDAEKSRLEDQILAVNKPLADLKTAKAKIVKDREELLVRLRREKPQIANTLRDLPMMDFFDPRLKIQQQLLPNVLEDYNFAKIEKNDRCHTCHRGIDNPGYEVETFPDAKEAALRVRFKDSFLRSYVDHARGEPKDPKDCDVCKSVAAGTMIEQIKHAGWTGEEVVKYTKTLMAHPRLDLYVSGASPHSLDKVGCTSCHEGDGRDTEFSRVVHMPDSESQWKEWENRHHYHYRHLWDTPMLPKRHIYASCRKCHNQEVELAGAEDYTKGMQIYERAGCYACHRTDSYQVLPKDVDVDPAKDPTGAMARKLDVSRKYRRPGPPLTHVKDKVSPDWAVKWVLAPKDFRLATRMPHFFGQSNARTLKIEGKEYPPQQVEPLIVGSMVKYLFEASASRNYSAVAPGAVPADAKRGEAIFEQVGCRACHTAAPDSSYARKTILRNEDDLRRAPDGESWYLKEFGPNLAGIASKFADNPERGATWLYNWVKNPKHYFKGSRMPDFRLSEAEAADLVAYLMSLRKEGDFDARPGMPKFGETEHKILDHLIFELLRGKMPDVDAREAVAAMKPKPEEKILWLGRKLVLNHGCYSCHEMNPEKAADPLLSRLPIVETPIDWTNIEGIGVELTGAQPEGNKAVDRLAFGYTHFDGVALDKDGANHHGVSFEHGYTKKPYRHLDPENPQPERVKVREFRHIWIKNKLLDPRVFDGGRMSSLPVDEMLRMPNFYLNPEEVRLVTTFVLSFTYHDFPAQLVNNVKRKLNPDDLAINRGNRLIRENNCRSCHRFTLDKLELEWTREITDAAGRPKKVTTREWVEGLPAGKATAEEKAMLLTSWGLKPATAEDLAALEIHIFEWVSDGSNMKMHSMIKPASKFVLARGKEAWYLDLETKPVTLHPVTQWVPTQGGDIIDHIRKYKKAHREDWVKDDEELVDVDNPVVMFSRYPPMLRSQGVKTQPQWLFDFLKRPYPIRPALAPIQRGAVAPPDVNVRMPSFGFTDEEASSVVRYFWSRDRLAPEETHPYTDFPERDEATLAKRKEPLQKMAQFAADPKNCGQCHFVSGRQPPGGPEYSYKWAPELEKVENRLRSRWLHPWMKTPGEIYPGTSMTAFDFSAFGSQEEGLQLAVEYLMNYKRFKATAEEPKK